VTYDYESKSTYSVTVDASDGNGGSASKSVTITLNDVNEPPSSAPSNVRVTSGDGQLTVEWDAVSNESGKPPVSGYHVERRTGTSGSWGNGHTISGRRPSTSATLSGLKNGQEYQVRVRARNAEGESGWSSAVSGTPMPTPSGLTVTNITLTSARASWTAPSDISSLINDYETRVYQDTTQIGRTVYTTRTYRSIAGLTEGTTYQVRVRARNSDANPNTFSAQITQDFTTLVPPPPGVPDVEDISYVFDPDTLWDEIEVSWNDGTGIVEFYEFEFTPRLSSVRNPIRINRRPGYFWGGPPGSEGSTTGYLTGEKTVHENTSVVSLLVNGTTYSIRMRAGNAGGVSGWSGSYTVYWDMDDE
ncbi:MAG: fibronectin type III domain-containing protein, partial [Gemmatimonadetes bacterium]|nr:fibronectin type III domain-containing protein [Gemmatimonadota bacterium]